MAKKPKPLAPAAEMEGFVTHSVSLVRKKGMPANIPVLSSDDPQQIACWAQALFSICGPKQKEQKEGEVEPPQQKTASEFFSSLPAVLADMGHVGFKTPNPLVSTKPIMLPHAPCAPGEGLIGPGTMPLAMGYFGHARFIREAKFLMARIIIDGRLSNPLSEITNHPEGSVVEALKAIGLSSEVIEEICAAAKARTESSLDKTAIHPLTKQVFFEAEGQPDILIIPSACDSLIAGVWNEVNHGDPLRHRPTRRTCHVGGANPVNGGSLSSDIGGAFPLLMAIPPVSRIPSIETALKKGWSIYGKYAIAADTVQTFVRLAPTEQKTSNLKEREAEQALHTWFAEALCAPLLIADELVAENSELQGKQQGAIGDYLHRNRKISCDPDITKAAAIEIASAVAMHHKDLQMLVADQTILRLLTGKMMKELA